MNSVFTKDSPARSISELLDHLWDGEPTDFVYRGQVREYRFLLPTMFRQALDDKPAPAGYISVSPERFHATLTSARTTNRAEFTTYLIREFGWGLGNLLAQQYGLQSECIDVTCNPDVAAFFATRQYPRYSIVEESSELESLSGDFLCS